MRYFEFEFENYASETTKREKCRVRIFRYKIVFRENLVNVFFSVKNERTLNAKQISYNIFVKCK